MKRKVQPKAVVGFYAKSLESLKHLVEKIKKLFIKVWNMQKLLNFAPIHYKCAESEKVGDDDDAIVVCFLNKRQDLSKIVWSYALMLSNYFPFLFWLRKLVGKRKYNIKLSGQRNSCYHNPIFSFPEEEILSGNEDRILLDSAAATPLQTFYQTNLWSCNSRRFKMF